MTACSSSFSSSLRRLYLLLPLTILKKRLVLVYTLLSSLSLKLLTPTLTLLQDELLQCPFELFPLLIKLISQHISTFQHINLRNLPRSLIFSPLTSSKTSTFNSFNFPFILQLSHELETVSSLNIILTPPLSNRALEIMMHNPHIFKLCPIT